MRVANGNAIQMDDPVTCCRAEPSICTPTGLSASPVEISKLINASAAQPISTGNPKTSTKPKDARGPIKKIKVFVMGRDIALIRDFNLSRNVRIPFIKLVNPLF